MGANPFTPEEVAALRASFVRFIPHSDEVATAMYSRLFAENPQIQSMFTTDPAQQRDKLVYTLAVMLDALASRGDLETIGRSMGAKHRGYGVTDDMYVTLKDYLVEALQSKVVPPLSADELGLWSRLYDEIARSMTAP